MDIQREMRPKISIERGTKPDGDVVFLSTDSQGLQGELNRYVLEGLGLDQSAMPGRVELARGYAIRDAGARTLAFIVTVNGNDVANNLRANLAAALSEVSITSGSRLWIPLMGSGSGGLAPLTSLSAVLEAIGKVPKLALLGVHIVISASPTTSSTEFEALIQLYRQRIQSDPGKPGATATGAVGQEGELNQPLPDTSEGWCAQDLAAFLQVAAGFGRCRRDPSERLTTRLLIFALAHATRPGVPSEFAAAASARHFGAALKALAGPAFKKMLDSYFDPGAIARLRIAAYSTPVEMSKNSERLFARAADAARHAGRTKVTVGDFITALLATGEDRVREVLAAMNVSPEDLLREYQRLASTAELSVYGDATISNRLVHDQASSRDDLDFDQYAFAIASFLMGPDTKGPISISIQAPWGAGKSSLMKQIRNKLDANAGQAKGEGHARIVDVLNFLNRKPGGMDKPRLSLELWTVWFNAWKYESSEQVWAGLVDAIISQVSDRMPATERELFLLRLNLARIDDGEVRKTIYDRVATIWWAAGRWLLTAMAALIALSLAIRAGDLVFLAAFGVGGGSALLAVRAWFKVWNEPASFSLARYVRVPDYGKSAGIVHEIHRDLQRVVRELPKRALADGKGWLTQPLVIFVDDLDRCAPNKVASIVEGINTFLAGDQPEFLFIIGMDPQMVAAALEHAHKDVKSYLPSYEQAVPLGWRFMDKFIQLAFTIPPRRGPAIELFVHSLTAATSNPHAADGAETPIKGASASAAPPARHVEPVEAQRVQEAVSKTITNESEDVREMMKGITNALHCSPREIKRILNFVRFVLLLRVGRISRHEMVPDLKIYERWIILCIRWPDLARWLQWGTERPIPLDRSPTLDGLTAQRLYMLEHAAAESGKTLEEWGNSAASNLRLAHGKVSWLADPDMYRFFINETAHHPDQRLSRGASVGFY